MPLTNSTTTTACLGHLLRLPLSPTATLLAPPLFSIQISNIGHSRVAGFVDIAINRRKVADTILITVAYS
ncbi:hypothetical protein glysoja_023701 [Glycine soja]|nr:hypothetical protein glysoja_023701 [Glycine soja]